MRFQKYLFTTLVVVVLLGISGSPNPVQAIGSQGPVHPGDPLPDKIKYPDEQDQKGKRAELPAAMAATEAVAGAFIEDPLISAASIIDVCPSGCSYSSIQAGVNAALAGDTVTVSAGTYNETVVIDKAITLQGAGIGSTIVDAQNTGPGWVFCVKDDATIDGFSITRPAATITDDGCGWGTGYDGWGISTVQWGSLTLSRSEIYDAPRGLHFSSQLGETVFLYNNVFHDIPGQAFYSAFTTTIIAYNNTFADNGTGMAVYGEDADVTIRNNIFDGNTYGINFTFDTVTHSVGHNLNNDTSFMTTDGTDFTGDPAFADRTNGDYHILPTSDAIDAGVNDGYTPSVDIDGDSRPLLSGIDVGADESPSSLPGNDDMADATVVSSLPYTKTQSTTGATLEAGEPSYSCGWNVGKTVWYQYTAASTGDLLVSTAGTDFDTVIHVYEDTGGSLSLVNCLDDWAWADAKFIVPVTSGKTYLISVGGYSGDSGNLTFHLETPAAFTSCSAVDVPTAECNVLNNLYSNNNGTNWYDKSGWFTNNQVCSWKGISCWSGSVGAISLRYNNLSGTLSTDFTSLPYLSYLYFDGNALSGNMSTIIGNLPTTLELINLRANNFSGTIPASIANFTYLYELYLGENNLDGNMSTIISNLPTSLEYISLWGNQFTGTIPASISNFTYLYELWLGENNLGGDIATIIGYLPTTLSYLDLGTNNFTGTIPSMSAFTYLYGLYLDNNSLTGDLSTALGNLPTSINYLVLGNNNFTGTVPSSISNFTYLYSLLISDNPSLSGTIPIEITNSNLGYFSFSGTSLCAPESSAYGTWAAGLYYYYPNSCNPPTGAFTAPTAEGSLMFPRTWLSVDASDSNGEVKSVDFWAYYDGSWQYLGTDTDGEDGWAYLWNTSNISDQTVNVWADIFDNAANLASISLDNISLSDTITFGYGYESRGSRTEDVENVQSGICEVGLLAEVDDTSIDTLQLFEPLPNSGAHIQQPN